MSSNIHSQANWADIDAFDADTQKIINSLLAHPSASGIDSNTTTNSDDNDFASAFSSSSAAPSLTDDATLFGLSDSVPLGVSPSVASQHQYDPSKSSSAWSMPDDFAPDTTYSAFSDSMLPSLSDGDTITPSDAPSLQSDMVHPLGTIPPAGLPMDDMLEGGFTDVSKDNTASMPSPLVPNSTLTGYHSNIASDHAAHLADLVKASNIVNAGHPGPRSLASSLSRSVLNADAIGRPDVSHHDDVHAHPKGLTIQQRRRMSHMARPSTSASPDIMPHPAPSPIKPTRRRQNSAPDPSLPSIASSPETPNTPLPKHRRPYRGSFDSSIDSLAPPAVGPPASTQDVDSWMDAVVANSHDLVFVLSLKGTVLYMSPSVHRILGFHPEEIIGRPLVDFSHPADIGPFSRELKEAITMPSGDDRDPDAHNTTAVKAHRRVDLIMRMACKNGTFNLIETTGRVSVDPPKHRKVVVCSGRPHPVPMLPWNDVRQDLMNLELSAWLKISHNGIFLGSTGPIQKILGIEDINLLGRHVRDLPMVTSSSDLLDALRCGRCISVQDHYEDTETKQKAPVKLTVYPWTSNGRSHAVSFVHVQQQPAPQSASSSARQSPAPSTSSVPAKRKASDAELTGASEQQTGSGSLSGSAFQANGTSVPVMTAHDAANTVFSELTGFHAGSWLIEMQRLHHANRKLRHELSALASHRGATADGSSPPTRVSACS